MITVILAVTSFRGQARRAASVARSGLVMAPGHQSEMRDEMPTEMKTHLFVRSFEGSRAGKHTICGKRVSRVVVTNDTEKVNCVMCARIVARHPSLKDEARKGDNPPPRSLP